MDFFIYIKRHKRIVFNWSLDKKILVWIIEECLYFELFTTCYINE